MAQNYSLFVFSYNIPVRPSDISDCLSEWTECKVTSIDYVISGYSSYYFVHFDRMISKKIIDGLSLGKQVLHTRSGDIQVGLDKSNGIDPNTTDTIVQFITNKKGSYHRYFSKPDDIFIWDEEAGLWMLTNENPFEIQLFDMEDDFSETSSTCSSEKIYGAPFMIQSIDEVFCSSDEEERSTRNEAPERPVKKQKTKKRFMKTSAEMSLCRTLFA
jgi:hypothetical protein